MNLTFKGFCTRYVQELTGLHTTSLRRLLTSVLNGTPQAAEALWCLAAASGKLSHLLRISEGTELAYEYALLEAEAEGLDLGDVLSGRGDRYGKVWDAYLAAKDPQHMKRHLASRLRPEVKRALKANGANPCAAARALGLTRGNVYNWLKGDDKALSPQTVGRLYSWATDDHSFDYALEAA